MTKKLGIFSLFLIVVVMVMASSNAFAASVLSYIKVSPGTVTIDGYNVTSPTKAVVTAVYVDSVTKNITSTKVVTQGVMFGSLTNATIDSSGNIKSKATVGTDFTYALYTEGAVTKSSNVDNPTNEGRYIYVTVNAPALSMPTGLSAALNDDTEVKLTWNAVSGASFYTIYRDDNYIGKTDLLNTYFYDAEYTGLKAGATYSYYVKAKNSSGLESLASNIVRITVPGISTPKPGAVTNLQATVKSSSQVDLSWSPATNATYYMIVRNGWVIPGTYTGTTYSDTGLIGNTAYEYYIVPQNNYGQGTSSNKVTVRTTAPSQPTLYDLELNLPTLAMNTNSDAGTVRVTAKYTDGTTSDVASASSFTSTSGAIAYVNDSRRLVSGSSAGTTTITVFYGGITKSVNVTVVNPSVVTFDRIEVSPSQIVIDGLNKATSQKFTVTARYTNNTTKDVSSQCTFSTSDANIVNWVNGSLQSGNKAGQATLTITYKDPASSVTKTIYPTVLVTTTSTPALSAPVLQTATATGTTEVKLTWTSVSGASYYRIFRDGQNEDRTWTPSRLDYYDTGLNPSTKYTYYVTAVDASGKESAASNRIEVITQGTLPGAVTNLEATVKGSSQIDLKWNAATYATYYMIVRNGSVLPGSYTGTTFSDTGLLANTSYEYYIIPQNNNGRGTVSNKVTVKTSESGTTTSLNAPTNLVARLNNDLEVKLTWTAVSGASKYIIYRDGTRLGNEPTDIQFYDAQYLGLTAGEHTYYVKAKNAAGQESAASSSVKITVPTPGTGTTPGTGSSTLSAPNGVSGYALSGTQINVTWYTVPGATGYKVYRNNNYITTATSTLYSDTGLTAGTTYTYYIKATNGTVDSTASNSISLTTQGTATTPTPGTGTTPGTGSSTLSAPNGVSGYALSGTQINVTWYTVPGATGYKVYRNNNYITTATSTLYSDTGLTAGTTYTYYLVATNGAVDSAASNSISLTTQGTTTIPNPGTTTPEKVAGLKATISGNQVNLTWNTTTNAQGYYVYRNSNNIATVISGISYSDTNLQANTSYKYFVKAYNGSVSGPNSDEITAITGTVGTTTPTQPTVTGFNDVPQSHWAYSAINKMVELGVVSGYDNGNFGPSDPVTREQFAKILVKSVNAQVTKPATGTFADVKPSDWSYEYVEAVKRYLTGYKYNGVLYFKPTERAVREDIAVAIVKAKGLDKQTPDLRVLDQFSDKNQISVNLRDLVAIAIQNKIMEGYGNGTFGAQNTLTRAEACYLIYNTIISNQNGEKVIIN